MDTKTFRAKEITRSNAGKWVYGDYFSQYKPETGTKHYIVEHPYGRDAGREIMWEIDPKTLGEFTGQTDRHGVRIYAGDIVKYKVPPNWITAAVYFSQEWATWFKGNGQNLSSYKKTTEVIGNAYDTPELKERYE